MNFLTAFLIGWALLVGPHGQPVGLVWVADAPASVGQFLAAPGAPDPSVRVGLTNERGDRVGWSRPGPDGRSWEVFDARGNRIGDGRSGR